MAGTLTISTLSDGTNSTSSTNCIQGSAKAWVSWTGSSGAISASYNVSSITRNGTGDYTANFTNAFADTKYSAVASCSANASSSVMIMVASSTSNGNIAPTTTALRMSVEGWNGTNYDVTYCNLAVFR